MGIELICCADRKAVPQLISIFGRRADDALAPRLSLVLSVSLYISWHTAGTMSAVAARVICVSFEEASVHFVYVISRNFPRVRGCVVVIVCCVRTCFVVDCVRFRSVRASECKKWRH